MRASRTGLALLVGADAGVLVASRPHVALLRHLAAPQHWLAAVGPDRAALELASAALWLTAAWLALGLTATVAAALPGTVGRGAQHAARAVLPRALRHLVAGAAGLGVLLAPALAGATPPGPARSSDVRAGDVLPTPAWPTDDALPSPALPMTTTPPRDAPAPGHATPHPAPAPAATTTPARPGPERHRAGVVVVRPGDSLWSIAAERLPARPSARRIAHAWPRWYAANRRVVGADPDHLVPGQVLHAPR